MNPLLQRPTKRRVVQVRLVSRPDYEVYVRALTGAEHAALYDKISGGPDKVGHSLAAQVEAYACDANGDPVLRDGEGFAAIDALDGIDVKRLIAEGDKLNILSSEAIEQERKN